MLYTLPFALYTDIRRIVLSVKIRLRRIGAKKKPFYRVVVADSRTPRDGRFIEQLGYYDPTTEPPVLKIDEEKAKLWLSRGAQPTDTAGALLKKLGLLARTKVVEATPKPEPEPAAEAEKPKKAARKKAEAAGVAAPAPAKKATTKAAPKAVAEETAEAPAEPAPAEAAAEAAPAEEPAVETPAEAPTEAPAETTEEAPAEQAE